MAPHHSDTSQSTGEPDAPADRFDDLLASPETGDDLCWVEATNGDRVLALTEKGRRAFCKRMVEVGGVYLEHHADLVAFAEAHPDVRLPQQVDSLKFQMLNLLLAHEGLAFSKADLMAVNAVMTAEFSLRASGDVIQAVNKTDQWGLDADHVRGRDGVRYYRILRPLRYNPHHRKDSLVVDVDDHLSDADWNARIEQHKDYYHRRYCSVPNEEWDRGHLVPGGTRTIPQPNSVNRSVRDRYILNTRGERVCPTSQHLLAEWDRNDVPVEEQRRQALVILERAKQMGWID